MTSYFHLCLQLESYRYSEAPLIIANSFTLNAQFLETFLWLHGGESVNVRNSYIPRICLAPTSTNSATQKLACKQKCIGGIFLNHNVSQFLENDFFQLACLDYKGRPLHLSCLVALTSVTNYSAWHAEVVVLREADQSRSVTFL